MPDPHVNDGLYTKPVYTFATLPLAANMQGETVWISDLSTAPIVSAGATAIGGGAFIGKVRSNGTVWKIVQPVGTP